MIRGPGRLELACHAIEGGRLVVERFHASSVEDLRRRSPRGYGLLRRWGGGTEGRVRIGGDFGDLADVEPDGPPLTGGPVGVTGSARSAAEIDEVFELIDTLDALAVAAGVPDAGRWCLRRVVGRCAFHARRRPTAEELSVRRQAMLPANAAIARRAIRECTFDDELRRWLDGLYEEALREVEALIASADARPGGSDAVAFHQRDQAVAGRVGRRVARLLTPAQRLELQAREQALRGAVAAVLDLPDALLDRLGELGVAEGQRDAIRAALRARRDPPRPPFDGDRVRLGLDLRERIRGLLNDRQRLDWDAATVHLEPSDPISGSD